MPGGDKTGPLGQGPLTGRGAGFCRGNNQPGYVSRDEFQPGGFGRGSGRGGRRGGGRGYRNQYYATGQPGWARRPGSALSDREPVGKQNAAAGDQAEQVMEKRLEALQGEIKELRRQLDDLKSGAQE